MAHNIKVSPRLPRSPTLDARGRTDDEERHFSPDAVPLITTAPLYGARIPGSPLRALDINDSAAVSNNQSPCYRAAVPGNAPPQPDYAISYAGASENAVIRAANHTPSQALRLSPRGVNIQDPQYMRARSVSRVTPQDTVEGSGLALIEPTTMGRRGASTLFNDAATSPRTGSAVATGMSRSTMRTALRHVAPIRHCCEACVRADATHHACAAGNSAPPLTNSRIHCDSHPTLDLRRYYG